MSIHPRFAEALQHLYPAADLRTDVLVQDDGAGPYLAQWNLPGEPPTAAQIDVALAEVDAAGALVSVLSYQEFRARWTEAELEALFGAERSDWRVRDFINLATAQGDINLATPTAAAAKALFVTLAVLTTARADKVFSRDR